MVTARRDTTEVYAISEKETEDISTWLWNDGTCVLMFDLRMSKLVWVDMIDITYGWAEGLNDIFRFDVAVLLQLQRGCPKRIERFRFSNLNDFPFVRRDHTRIHAWYGDVMWCRFDIYRQRKGRDVREDKFQIILRCRCEIEIWWWYCVLWCTHSSCQSNLWILLSDIYIGLPIHCKKTFRWYCRDCSCRDSDFDRRKLCHVHRVHKIVQFCGWGSMWLHAYRRSFRRRHLKRELRKRRRIRGVNIRWGRWRALDANLFGYRRDVRKYHG